VITLGASGLAMLSRMPSPMQAPAAMSLAGNAVMSWQPVFEYRQPISWAGRPAQEAAAN